MFKYIGMVFMVVLASCYYFPFETVALPGANTKMIIAAMSLPVIVVQMARGNIRSMRKEFVQLIVWALLMSLACLFSVTYNSTNDHSYTSYIISMLVWLGGAYMVVSCIRWLHGQITPKLVCNYVIAVCVAQCFVAYAIDLYPAFSNFVDGFIAGEAYMGNVDARMHGIGCALDVAGLRFSAALVMIAFLVVHANSEEKKFLPWYIAAFLIISVIGCMLGRSTLIGILLAFAYWAIVTLFYKDSWLARNKRRLWWCFVGVLAITIPLIVYFYNTNQAFHDNLRFGFEGFFSLWEKGEWDVHSNEILKNMVVYPDNMKTWVLGDGYMENPMGTDPYYVGKIYGGYYMGTDIGYLRFIFYCGLLGLSIFTIYFVRVMQVCASRFNAYKAMFIMILLVNFIGWIKVSTDIFVAFALFLCIPENEECLTMN
jgi:hypothetical protein